LSETTEAFPCRIVIASGSGVLFLLKAAEKNGLVKGTSHPTCDCDNQETPEICSGKIDVFSPGMAGESETECQMDASVKISVRESKCQLSSSKTSEQEN